MVELPAPEPTPSLDPALEAPVLEAPPGPAGPALSNGFPRSGLGEFMVEVARASELPVSGAPVEPAERVTVMIELPRQLHCHRYVDDNAVSRDKCRLFPRIEKPVAPIAR